MIKIKLVKDRIVILMIIFALTVSIILLIFSYGLMYKFQKTTTISSIQFNIELIANLIEQDLVDLTSLGVRSKENEVLIDYFSSYEKNDIKNLNAYYSLRKEYIRNKSERYVAKLIAVNNTNSKIIQINEYNTDATPLTIYSVDKLQSFFNDKSFETWEITTDPYYRDNQVLASKYKMYNPSDSSHLGYIYLSLSTDVITDKLKGYNMPKNSELYITFGNKNYKIVDQKNLVEEEYTWKVVEELPSNLNSRGKIETVQNENGVKRTAVTYKIRDGITITQLVSNSQYAPEKNSVYILITVVFILIVTVTILVTYNLDKNISKPIAKLSKKISEITLGDFTVDKELESDSELGEVGIGINKLSEEIVSLMERRIAVEKRGMDLEYTMLQNQINPHFLYNTLNSIKWMATSQEANGIAEMTTALSYLLRSISKDLRKAIPLEEELLLLDNYMLIQSYRYGGTIKFEKNIEDPELLAIEIPRFSLQPIVENAIFHGIEPKGTGTITVDVVREGSDVLVSVTDDGVGMSKKTLSELLPENKQENFDKIRKLGVSNVNDRLIHIYGKDYGLTVESKLFTYTKMTIRLPIKENKNIGENINENMMQNEIDES